MMEGIVLAVLALLSVPVLLIVILVKVCGLENKVADLTKKVGVIDLTRRNGAAENIVSRRDAEAQRGLELGAKPPAPQPDLRVSASLRDASPAPSTSEVKPSASTVSPERSEPHQRSLEGCAEGAKAPSTSAAGTQAPSTSAEGAQAPTVPPAPQTNLRVSAPPREIPKTPYEPTAFDMFWMRIEDWFAVRGDFAPKGMTHEFAFATRWLIRVGAVLIIGAIVYFVKLSIDRGWMGPTGRVAATLFWGMAGCVGGSWLVKKDKYALLGHAIAALGVVALSRPSSHSPRSPALRSSQE